MDRSEGTWHMSAKNSARPGSCSGVTPHGSRERCDVRRTRTAAELKTYRAYVAHVSCCGQCGPKRCPVGAALCRAYLKEVNSPG